MDNIENRIMNDGFLYNDKLYKKWLMMQIMRHNTFDEKTFNNYFITEKPYGYEWSTAINEINVLSKVSAKERLAKEQFFNRYVIKQMLNHYLSHVALYCKLSNDTKRDIIKSASNLKSILKEKSSKNGYVHLYKELKKFTKIAPMPANMPKSEAWSNAFKNAGAYYTMDMLIKFENYRFYDSNKNQKSLYDSLKILNAYLTDNEKPDLANVITDFMHDNNSAK